MGVDTLGGSEPSGSENDVVGRLSTLPSRPL